MIFKPEQRCIGENETAPQYFAATTMFNSGNSVIELQASSFTQTKGQTSSWERGFCLDDDLEAHPEEV